MSIGSVPPSRYTNCIRNVTFRNVEYQHPIKVYITASVDPASPCTFWLTGWFLALLCGYQAIYIKTDPGTEGDGIISNITYENIYAETALW